MRYYFVSVIILLFSLTLQSQSDTNGSKAKKNSIGLTISPQDVGIGFFDKDVPTVRLDYRRLLQNDLEFRFSLGYQHDSNNISNSGYSVALGLNKFLYQSRKIDIYAGAELAFDRANVFDQHSGTERNYFKNWNINMSLLLGVEYKATDRLGIFIEPKLMNFTLFQKNDNITKFSVDSPKFFMERR